jgi:acyl dehydratase
MSGAEVDATALGAPAGEITLDDIKARVAGEPWVSEWQVIDQATIDAFAEVSGDHQYIHVDIERARQTPFGGTIAHGFLVLCWLSRFRAEAVPRIAGTTMGINYGLDRVRFTAPVPASSRLRGRFELAKLETKEATETSETVQLAWDCTIEIEGGKRPAVVARWLTRAVVAKSP